MAARQAFTDVAAALRQQRQEGALVVLTAAGSNRHPLRTREEATPASSSCQEVAMPDNIMLQRIRAEYLEMPGMRLTARQVQRLCSIEATVCQWALDALIDAKFLRVTPGGQYCRVTDGDIPRPLPARADLRAGQRSVKAS